MKRTLLLGVGFCQFGIWNDWGSDSFTSNRTLFDAHRQGLQEDRKRSMTGSRKRKSIKPI